MSAKPVIALIVIARSAAVVIDRVTNRLKEKTKIRFSRYDLTGFRILNKKKKKQLSAIRLLYISCFRMIDKSTTLKRRITTDPTTNDTKFEMFV